MHHKLALYKCAADLLKLAKETGVNIKHVLYNEKKYKFMNIKSLFALVTEALKHWNIVELLINESKILENEPGLNVWHVRILITELNFGKKVIDDGNELGYKILQYENKFRELLSRQDIQKIEASKKNLGIKVRYIKVNTIKKDVDAVINTFIEEGWHQVPTADSYQEYLDQLKELEPHSEFFVQDFHIPEILVFPPGTELYSHYLFKNGSFFFMDKSSCLAPYLLCPQQDSSVLDMCAAPGLKTIQLAGLVQDGMVYAVEKNPARFQSLKEMVELSGADNVVPIQEDVTKIQVKQYADVKYILLDPSCSGSGMRERQPVAREDISYNDKKRLHQLAGFQLTLLRFALTRFPAVKRVVYSTCSLNVEENEEVVEAALNSKYHNFKIASSGKKLSEWINFGSEKFSFASKCIYSKPEIDQTNGFFVAVFKRRKNPIPKGMPESFVNDNNKELSFNENSNSKFPKVMEFGEISKDIKSNQILSNSDTKKKKLAKYDQNNSKYDKSPTVTQSTIEETIIKKTKSKKRVHDTAIDTVSTFSSRNKCLRTNENISLHSNPLEPMKKTVSGESETKRVTSSRKKRLRQQKRHQSLIQSNNTITKRKIKERNASLLKNSSSQVKVTSNKVMSKNDVSETCNHNGTTRKISRAQLRSLRTKKLKLKESLKNTIAVTPCSPVSSEAKKKSIAKLLNTSKENASSKSTLRDSVGQSSKHKTVVSPCSKNFKLSLKKIKNKKQHDNKYPISNANDTDVVLE